MSASDPEHGSSAIDAADEADVLAYGDLPADKAAVLLVSIAIVALCGIVYELLIGTVSSYLLGSSVHQFSLTIGFFMFAMGVGSYLSRHVEANLIEMFVRVEMVLSLLGGLCSISLFLLFPFAPWIYQAAMFGFILSIGALVGLEIPLLTRVLAARKGTRRSIAAVMTLDYFGALIGSVAFPLLLLPSLGLVSASFAIGLANGLVALLNVIWLRDYLRNPRLHLQLAIGTLALLVLLTAMAGRITAFAQNHLFMDQVIMEKTTPYQSLVVTRAYPREDLRLFIDGHLQFSQWDEHRYHEALVHPAMAPSGPKTRVLVMGGGDGLAVREVLKYSGVEQIDVVDIDPEMTRLGAEFGPLVALNRGAMLDPRVNVYNEDAFSYIRKTKTLYDRVIIDFPDPHSEALSKLYAIEFYTMVSARMQPWAVLTTQSSSPFFARRTYWSVAETMRAVYPGVTSYSVAIPAFGVWGFHLARKTGDDVPALTDLPGGMAFLTPEVFTASQVFAADIARPDGDLDVNSVFEPGLYQTYLRDLRASPVERPGIL